MSRRRKRVPDQPETILEYFFEAGNPTKPRRALVRRDELWQVLEWYQRRVAEHNRWHNRLWRLLRRWPSSRLNPFTWIRLRQAEEAGSDGR